MNSSLPTIRFYSTGSSTKITDPNRALEFLTQQVIFSPILYSGTQAQLVTEYGTGVAFIIDSENKTLKRFGRKPIGPLMLRDDYTKPKFNGLGFTFSDSAGNHTVELVGKSSFAIDKDGKLLELQLPEDSDMLTIKSFWRGII